MSYPWRCPLSVVVICRVSSVSTITTKIIKISNLYLVQMFIMFKDCASLVLVAPPTLVI